MQRRNDECGRLCRSYKRLIESNNMRSQRSLFLFGSRQVGKSTAIAQQLPDAYVIDLFDSDRFTTFLRRPKALGEELEHSQARVVVIDEIQKIPVLLNLRVRCF